MEITIRRAVPDDRTKIMPLQKEIADIHYHGRPDLFQTAARYYSEAQFEEKLNHPDHRIFIAETGDGEVAGYAFAVVQRIKGHSTYVDFNRFYIDDICVAEKFRRMGVATKLFERCREQAKTDGCHNLELAVFCFNEDAIAFYEKVGMRPMIQRMELLLDGEEKR